MTDRSKKIHCVTSENRVCVIHMSKDDAKKVKITPTFEQNISKAQKKLEELILYIAAKCQNDPNFGATKLNKILYFSDFYHYGNHGKGITGIEYMKLDHGPAPKKLLPVSRRMQKNGDIAVQEISLSSDHKQKRVVALRDADLSVFSAEEINTVHMILDALKFKNAKDVSNLSHGRAWRIAGLQESIPYESFWISDENITPCDKDITDQMIKRGDLCLNGVR
jgi:hypothetical protein